LGQKPWKVFAMDAKRAIEIIRALSDGIDPLTALDAETSSA
jgi:hypothetical protein